MTTQKKFQHVPYYKKTLLIDCLPLVSFASFTPKERAWISEQRSQTQKINDQRTSTLLDSIAKSLKCNRLEAMVAFQSVQFDETPDPKHSAAVQLAIMENRQEIIDNTIPEMTFMINSRLDRNEFDAIEFQKKYKIAFDGEWTDDHTLAVEDLHAGIQAFMDGETNATKLEDEPEVISAGEPTIDSKKD